jgi:hypothetical protein
LRSLPAPRAPRRAAATPIAIAHIENGANLIGSDIHLVAA